jgi:hypothetical protein
MTLLIPQLSDSTSVDQTPNLKLVQLGSAGWGHLENMPLQVSLTSLCGILG